MPRNGVLGIGLGLANSDLIYNQPQKAPKKVIESNYSSASSDNKYKDSENFLSMRNKVSMNTVFGRLNPVSRLKKVVIGVAAGPFHSLAWTSDG